MGILLTNVSTSKPYLLTYDGYLEKYNLVCVLSPSSTNTTLLTPSA